MSSHPEDPSPSEEPILVPDDDQLTIRIPNPKAYMARQSQWVGRRGKPRCDHCRTANLKCDRVLPMCNHCSWANEKECVYTPLPTPAHRGIPRCDRCRAANQKCDRNLPVCSSCKEAEDGKGVPCNYTPKKRSSKRTAEGDGPDSSGGTETHGRASPKGKRPRRTSNDMAINTSPAPRTDHTFYGHNVASTSALPNHLSTTHSDFEMTPEIDMGHTGRFTASFTAEPAKERLQTPQAPVPYPIGETPHTSAPDITHSPPLPTTSTHLQTHTTLLPNKDMRRSALDNQPWSHPSFVPLPQFALKDLARIKHGEHPTRLDFDIGIWALLQNLVEGLRETTLLNVDAYTKVVHAIQAGDDIGLSDRMHTWASIHHLTVGPGKQNVILVPGERAFEMDDETAERHRRHFLNVLMDPAADASSIKACLYGRLPVQNQLYDILAWAHRSHASAGEMLTEVASLGFAFVTWTMAEMYARMCPHCNRWRRTEVATASAPTMEALYAPTPRTPVDVPIWGPYVPQGF